MARREFCLIPPELVEDLRKVFPNECIGEHETPEQAHRRAGKQDLIKWLASRSDMQQAAMSGDVAAINSVTALNEALFEEDVGSTSVDMETR